MSMTMDQVEEALLALNRRDRAAVIQRGLRSLDDEIEETSQEEIDAAWRDELSRRIDDIESGKVKMLSFDEVLANVRDELAKIRQ